MGPGNKVGPGNKAGPWNKEGPWNREGPAGHSELFTMRPSHVKTL